MKSTNTTPHHSNSHHPENMPIIPDEVIMESKKPYNIILPIILCIAAFFILFGITILVLQYYSKPKPVDDSNTAEQEQDKQDTLETKDATEQPDSANQITPTNPNQPTNPSQPEETPDD